MRERQFVADLVSSQDLPKMFKVRQTFPRPRIEPEDIPGIIRGIPVRGEFCSESQAGYEDCHYGRIQGDCKRGPGHKDNCGLC